MKPGRIAVLVVGCLLVLPGIGMLFGGAGLGLAYAFARDDDGYFDTTLDRMETRTVAITTEDDTFMVEPGDPDWVIDALDADVRIRATSADTTKDVFIGIGPERDVDAYLSGAGHDEVTEVQDGDRPIYRNRRGGTEVAPPTEQGFWVAEASGPGTQEMTWETESGRWAAVLMNADGSPGVAADVNVGVKVGLLLPLALILLGLGALVTAAGVVLIVVAATGARRHEGEQPPAGIAAAVPAAAGAEAPLARSPVALAGLLDPALSRWQWLVKWFLAIPHFIVLAFLWIAFFTLTVVAGFSILFTGRYPRGIFDFNLGVLRWTWRVSFYAHTGGIGTDQYPPFSLGEESGYPATLDITYPEHLSRGLVLVKWWLLAIPHYVIVGVLVGGGLGWGWGDAQISGPGVLGVLVFVAAVILLFTATYPKALFDLIVGFNRWIYRVIAYAALMTDQYPPFRLDQGGNEPAPVPPGLPPRDPANGDVDLREVEAVR